MASLSNGIGTASAAREPKEIERVEQRLREHISYVQNNIDYLAGILIALRGELPVEGKASQLTEATRPGLMGEIHRLQNDLDDRLSVLASQVSELRNYA